MLLFLAYFFPAGMRFPSEAPTNTLKPLRLIFPVRIWLSVIVKCVCCLFGFAITVCPATMNSFHCKQRIWHHHHHNHKRDHNRDHHNNNSYNHTWISIFPETLKTIGRFKWLETICGYFCVCFCVSLSSSLFVVWSFGPVFNNISFTLCTPHQWLMEWSMGARSGVWPAVRDTEERERERRRAGASGAGAGGAQLKAADLILCIIKQSHSMQHPLYIIHAQ